MPSTTNNATPSAITHTPWNVLPGTHHCANGSTQYLSGRDHFWDANVGHENNTTSTSLVCHAAKTEADALSEAGGEKQAMGRQAPTKERCEEMLRGLIIDEKSAGKTA